MGTGAGNLYTISVKSQKVGFYFSLKTLDPQTSNHQAEILRREYSGFIQAISANIDGSQLAVGYTSEVEVAVVLVDDPVSRELKSALTSTILVSTLMQSLELHRPLKRLPITNRRAASLVPHTISYLEPESLLVGFLDYGVLYVPTLLNTVLLRENPIKLLCNTCSFSTPLEHSATWRSPIHVSQVRALIRFLLTSISRGRIAISPLQHLLAATNFIDGIDWYSLRTQTYIGSTHYSVKGKDGSVRAIGLDFVDNDTVVAGHADGGVVLARPTMNSPVRFDLKAETQRLGDSSRQLPIRA